MSRLETTPSVQSSQAEVWYLKNIFFGSPGEEKQPFKIITQNFNGPCSFIAICNILILRGNIQILPPTRKTVSYEFLSQLVAEYLLTSALDVDISAALSIMPYTQKGMDLNPLFTAATSFRPSGGGTGELDLFEKARIQLVHGWLVDPESEEAEVIQRVKDYDRAVELIAEVDHLTHGKLVQDESVFHEPGGSSSQPSTSPTNYTDGQRRKIEDAIIIRKFLQNTSSQLTYHGLFHLAQTLTPHTLYALFRNSHLSVIYKTDGEDSAIYGLVTDQVFLNEPSIVWERLEDVDGGSSTWVDMDFRRSNPAGGDFAGQTAEEALAAAEIAAGIIDPADHALAQQLQAEEEQIARHEHERYLRAQQERAALHQAHQQELEKKRAKKKKSRECIIM